MLDSCGAPLHSGPLHSILELEWVPLSLTYRNCGKRNGEQPQRTGEVNHAHEIGL